jgi:hypothetical protein
MLDLQALERAANEQTRWMPKTAVLDLITEVRALREAIRPLATYNRVMPENIEQARQVLERITDKSL